MCNCQRLQDKETDKRQNRTLSTLDKEKGVNNDKGLNRKRPC